MTSFLGVDVEPTGEHVKVHGAQISDCFAWMTFLHQKSGRSCGCLLFCRVLFLNTSLSSILSTLSIPIHLIGEPLLHLVSLAS
jgi:hypothetical protein